MAHVSLITLGVEDLTRATRFYEALGWHRSDASVEGTIAFLRGGAMVLALFGRHELVEEAGTDLHAAGSGPVALAMNVGAEATVDATLATAEAAGGSITRPAVRAEWGGYSGYFSDPDGHLWEVAHNPTFRLLDDGRVVLPDEEDRPPDPRDRSTELGQRR
jgi:uncharacterized protein